MHHSPISAAKRFPSNDSDSRYRLFVEPAEPTIRVYDVVLKRPVFEWSGPVAGALVRGGTIPSVTTGQPMSVGKTFVRSLLLAATAARIELDRNRPQLDENSESRIRRFPDRTLVRRLGARELSLSGSHLCIARILFERRGEHLSEDDVTCLALLDCPSVNVETVRSCLADLARWRIVQRVVVDEDNVFYDTETRPHLHVFDPVRRRLKDAPQRGVIAVASGA